MTDSWSSLILRAMNPLNETVLALQFVALHAELHCSKCL